VKTILALATLVASLAAHATPPDPARDAQARAALAQAAPGTAFEADAAAFGDLDGDGVDDFAIVAGDPHGGAAGAGNMRAYVFKGLPQGGFRLVASSAPVDYAVVSIRRGSVFLNRDGASGCCAHWAHGFQFKMRDGQLMLIGVESGLYHPDGVREPDQGTSANLVTGQVEHWTGRDGKPQHRTRRAVPGLAPVPLAGFDGDAFEARWRDLF
jgi:hypothetical protein